jgi:holo-[acyl-carrier protein] synthase
MIIGSGIDMVEIGRIQHSVDRYGKRFLNRVYTSDEQAYCLRKRNYAESLAARFAAKEAGAKALGTGISYGVNWLEIEVVREPSGRPTLHFHGRAAEIARRLGGARAALSVTHTAELAVASVVLEDGR